MKFIAIALILFSWTLMAEPSPTPTPEPTPTATATPIPVALAAPVTISGRLREKGTKKPLTDVNIYCFAPPDAPVPIKTVTDAKGDFHVDVTPGPIRWKISVANYVVYDRLDDTKSIAAGKKFYLEKKSYLTYETTVIGETEKRDDKTQTLTQDQFMTLPGANGDPVKAVQNLPGVNRANEFSAQVIVEGSAPADTRYNIDTQPVPIIFHFAGLDSVVMPEAIDRVDYLSAGFGPEYGETTAGLINLDTRDPQTDRTHGMAFVDVFHAGALIETPIDDHSNFLFGMRKSYIGEVLKSVAKSNSSFDLTAAPDFDDAIMMYTNKLNANDTLKLVAVGSVDTLGFVLPEPSDQDPSIRGNFSENVSFFRLMPEFTHKFSSGSIGRIWAGVGQDLTTENFGTFYYHDHANVASVRGEMEAQVNPTWKTYYGLDNNMTASQIDYQIPFFSGQSGVSSPISTDGLQTVSHNYFEDTTGLYWRNVVHPLGSRWTYLPGIRFEYYSLTRQFLPEPRLGARYAFDHGLTWRAATGMYGESPPVQDTDSTYGNPSLQAQRGLHITSGFEKDFRGGDSAGWVASTDLFYKYLYDLVQTTATVNSDGQPEYYNNGGTGQVYGAEVMVKYQSKKWSGWLAYTLSKSTRTYPPAGEQIFQYDQTNIMTLVAQRELGHNWKFSGRLRYTTGDPYTPIIGADYDVDNAVYVPISGGTYSERLPAFYEADVRFDKKWVFNAWTMTGYLDVENATNHKNVQQINYSYDYKQQAQVTGLPILPTLGIKGEF